MAAAGLKNIAT